MTQSTRDEFDLRLTALSPAQRAVFEREYGRRSETGHAAIARTLLMHGVSTVYGIPGVPVHATFAACAHEGLRLIGARHQQAAALMAVAHNYVAGAPVAVALVSSGPAASNALTGVIVARDNGWPLVMLAGAVPREPRNFGHFTELDVEALYRPVTKAAMTVERTLDIPRALDQAFAIAKRGRPGPVVLQLPADVVDGLAPAAAVVDRGDGSAAKHDSQSPAMLDGRSSAGDHDASPIDAGVLDAVARRLTGAARPLLILGKGARWNDAYADVRELVDALGLPFVTSPMARGYVPDDHPQCFNAVSWVAQREADVVLLLGLRLDWTFRHGTQIAPAAVVIQVDVHRPELGRNRAADIPIQGDIRTFARGVLARLSVSRSADPGSSRDAAWIESLRRRRLDVHASRDAECVSSGLSIAPAQLAHAVSSALPRNAITVLDGNLVLAECQRHIAVYDAVCRLTPGSNGCMGTGIPFAIGARLACPTRPVVAVCGDFAFGVSAIEMETAVRHRVPIVVVVANNDGSGGDRREREMFPDGHAERVSMFGPGIRYSELVRTFGGYAEHVEAVHALQPALARALAAGVPACVNVALDPHAPFPRQ